MDQYRSWPSGMRAAGGRVSGKVGARKRVTTTFPPVRSMNEATYALSRFDKKPPLPPAWSRSTGPAVGEPVTPIATPEATLTNLRHLGFAPGEGCRSGPDCWATASLTPSALGFSWSAHGD